LIIDFECRDIAYFYRFLKTKS